MQAFGTQKPSFLSTKEQSSYLKKRPNCWSCISLFLWAVAELLNVEVTFLYMICSAVQTIYVLLVCLVKSSDITVSSVDSEKNFCVFNPQISFFQRVCHLLMKVQLQLSFSGLPVEPVFCQTKQSFVASSGHIALEVFQDCLLVLGNVRTSCHVLLIPL